MSLGTRTTELRRRLRQTGGRARKLRGLIELLAPYRWRVAAMFFALLVAVCARIAIPLPGGTAFTDPAYATQLRACKLLFHRLQHEPAEGRRRWRSSTLRNAHSALRVLMPWMVAHGYRRFAELDDRTTRMFAAHLRQRKGRRGTLTPSGLVHHLSLLVALYEHRNELPDAPRTHPLGGETGSAFAGFQRSDEAPTPHIPDDIARDRVEKFISGELER